MARKHGRRRSRGRAEPEDKIALPGWPATLLWMLYAGGHVALPFVATVWISRPEAGLVAIPFLLFTGFMQLLFRKFLPMTVSGMLGLILPPVVLMGAMRLLRGDTDTGAAAVDFLVDLSTVYVCGMWLGLMLVLTIGPFVSKTVQEWGWRDVLRHLLKSAAQLVFIVPGVFIAVVLLDHAFDQIRGDAGGLPVMLSYLAYAVAIGQDTRVFFRRMMHDVSFW